MPYPDVVRVTVERYLRLVDAALPGRLEGLYLVGSVALADYRAGQSDVDFMAVTGERLQADELARMEEVHETIRAHGKPWFDGIYVVWTDFTRNPRTIESVPFTLRGRFEPAGGAEANPSVWLTLRNHPFAVRGPAAPPVWYDEAVIQRWNRANLNSYWRKQADQLDTVTWTEDDPSSDWATVWCVPGVARLHYTIATMDVISKSAACSYALGRFPPRWHTVIQEAAAVRAGGTGGERNPDERRHDVRDFMRFVIEDANALERPPRGAA